MWFPKFPYTNFSQINLDWILKQVRELAEWMNRYFKDIRQDLDKEINDRIEGDKALNARVDKEITDRTEADNVLGKRIDKEITDRTEADKQLQANIDAEKTAREEADRQLQANIDAEKTAREEADRQLTQDITQLRTDAILKDGSTNTTAAIPFAKGIKVGSISENSMGAGVAIESNLDLNNHTISSVLPGTDEFDAATVGQLDDKFADVHSIPAGGTPGQVLGKIDDTDYNVTWVNQTGGGGNVPAGGTTGQVLAKSTDADYQTEWVNQTGGLPEGGTVGQVVTKTAEGVEWADASTPANVITLDGGKQVITNPEWELSTNTSIKLSNLQNPEWKPCIEIEPNRVRLATLSSPHLTYIEAGVDRAIMTVDNSAAGVVCSKLTTGKSRLGLFGDGITVELTGQTPQIGQVLVVEDLHIISEDRVQAILGFKTI